MTKRYYLQNIRALLIEGFTDLELRNVCFDFPGFKPVYHQLAQNTGKTEIVSHLLEYAERTVQLDQLLDIAKNHNPARFIQYEPYFLDNLIIQSPYRGLQYFDTNDADLFFGRELLTAKLVNHLRDQRFLAVVGASGSGKSSLVRAGLIPALNQSRLLEDDPHPFDGSANWQVHVIRPTSHPLEALAVSLTRDSESVTATTTLMDDLAADTRSLHFYVRKILSHSQENWGKENRLLVVIDQFEELFTSCQNESERQAFIHNLLTAINPELGGPTSVVIALRADFYAHCARYDDLREALAKQQEYIGPMSPSELRQAIEKPAERSGWVIEPNLVDLLLDDVGDEPGALPLLSHALLETWKRRRGNKITFEGYIDSGRVQGAIAQTAETVFHQQLTPAQQPIARSIFLRLTELGEDAQDTRRRVTLTELLSSPVEGSIIETVIKILADARLITTEREFVEVAHEALIREWPTLRNWLDQDREAIRIYRRLSQAAQEWEKNNRDESYLYRGARLVEAEGWTSNHRNELSQSELAFLNASLAEREQKEIQQLLLLIAAEREVRFTKIQQISQRMVEASQNPDGVLELIARAANDIINSALTSVYLYNQATSTFTSGVSVWREGGVERIENSALPNPEDFAGQIAEGQGSDFIENTADRPEISSFVQRFAMQAFAALPLTIAGAQGLPTTVGVLFVNFKEPHVFSEDEREILRHLANQAAVAVAFTSAQAAALAQEQLVALGTATGTLQHRLGNTVNVILPAVLRLRHRVGDDATSLSILDTVERNALFAGEVIRRMQNPLRQEPFVRTNFNNLLREAVQKCIQENRYPHVSMLVDPLPSNSNDHDQPQLIVTTQLDEQLPETYASVGQMTEVFRVLVENAIKAIQPNAGFITINSQLTGNALGRFAEITVSDTGKGIEEKTQQRLFKQPVPRKEFGEGAGLGLWLSQIIVRSHQGVIRLHASEPGKGSTFWLRLPILTQPPLSHSVPRGEER